MKHLAVILAVFLLMGCQTTDTLPPTEASPEKIEVDEKLAKESLKPKEKAEHQKGNPNKPPFGSPGTTVVTTQKPLMCGDPTAVLNSVTKSAEEVPLAMWKDAQYGYPVIMLYNKKKRTSTILEYIPGFACFLSVGEDVHIQGLDFSPKKSGISVDRGLTKPLGSAINIVQFDDAN